ALDVARDVASEYGRVGLELSLGTQAADRMVGEPTTFPKAWFDAWPDAAAAMEHVQGVLRPGMTEAQAAAEWLGFVHGEGTGWNGQVELALGFALVWSGPGIRTFTATTAGPVVEH